MSTTTTLALPAMAIRLNLEPAGPAWALRTEGGQIVADVPADIRVSPRQAARLFAAWLKTGRPLDWRESAKAIAEGGGE